MYMLALYVPFLSVVNARRTSYRGYGNKPAVHAFEYRIEREKL